MLKAIWRAIWVSSVAGHFFLKALWLKVCARLCSGKYRDVDLRIGESLRDALFRLSGVFIKFGQILSMRPDLLPQDVVVKLQELLDSVPPEDVGTSLATLRAELGINDWREIFSEFDMEPLAAASFATVYAAKLKDDRRVAVKIQRANAHGLVNRDTIALRVVAAAIDALGVLKRFLLSNFVSDFVEWTKEELDYRREGRHIERLRAMHADNDRVVIPQVHWLYTTERVLVVDMLDGVWFSELLNRAKSGDLAGADYEEVARTLFRVIMEQMFEHGVFHADPHAGNLCLLADGRIGLIDFGIVGYLNEQLRKHQLELLVSINSENLDEAYQALTQLLHIPPDANVRLFRRLLDRNMRSWVLLQGQEGLDASARSAGKLLLENFQAARDSGISFTRDAARYYRAFIVLDSIIISLNPGFNYRAELVRYLTARARRRKLSHVEALTDQEYPFLLRFSTFLEETVSLLKRVDGFFHAASGGVEGVFRRSYLFLSDMLRVFSVGSLLSVVVLAGLYGLGLHGGGHGSVLGLGIANETLTLYSGRAAVAAVFSYVFFAWLSRMLWIRAYQPE